jgi:hypothetical protein
MCDSTIAEAVKRFDAFAVGQREAVHPDLRIPIFRAGVRANPSAAVTFLQKEWATTPAVDGKEVALQAIGYATDTEVINTSILPFNMGPDKATTVPAGDVHIIASVLAAGTVGRKAQWEWIQKSWESHIIPKIGGNPIVLDRFVNLALPKFSDRQSLEEIEAFFKGKDTKAFDRTLETVKDKIRGRIAYRERDAAGLREWLVARGYAEKQ